MIRNTSVFMFAGCGRSLAVASGSRGSGGGIRSGCRRSKEPGKVQVTIDGQDVATYVYADPNIPRPYFAHVRGPGGIQ